MKKKLKNSGNKTRNSTNCINQNKVTNISSASPKVRKFARELGVDINQVKGSERKGRVIESDVKLFVASKSNNSLK